MRWLNALDPAQQFGLMAAEPAARSALRLRGLPEEWQGKEPLYASRSDAPSRLAGNPYDPARHLKSLYVDADEAYLYLRLGVGKLDNNADGQPDWEEVQYVIGISTLPGRAGLRSLPLIAPMEFPMGMTYAVQLGGPEASRVWVASSYHPLRIEPVEGIPSQSGMILRRGWNSELTSRGTFEIQIAEPNRRRYGRDGRYYPPMRYERGLLRYGNLDPEAENYNSLAGWNANLATDVLDVRIPWALLGVTDPSTYQVLTRLRDDGSVETAETPGFLIAAFSYRPLSAAVNRPPMEQHHPVADSLPPLPLEANRVEASALRSFRWAGWDQPQYKLRPKESLTELRKVFLSLPTSPGQVPAASRTAERRNVPPASQPAAAGKRAR
jgi:hypothetical protein